MNILKLTHEYNEYIVGYVITDENTDRTLNFQLKQFDSNHPCPNYFLSHSHAGDNTSDDWSKIELKEARKYVKKQKDIQKWLKQLNIVHDAKQEKLEELIQKSEMDQYDFFDLVDKKSQKWLRELEI